MNVNRRFQPVEIIVVLLLLVSIGACNRNDSPLTTQSSSLTGTSDSSPDTNELQIADLRVSAYTREFGERFGYEGPGLSQLPPDLFALEFSVERSSSSIPAVYSCVLKVYLKSGLGIAYPEGGEISNIEAIGGRHFFAQQFEGWAPEDMERLTARFKEYEQKAFYFEVSGPDAGLQESFEYAEHHTQLYEGVDYLKLRRCFVFTDRIQKQTAALQLWLKLNAQPTLVGSSDQPEYLKIDLPQDFTREIAEKMSMVNRENSKILQTVE
jgi:hypothetical protein